MDKQNYYIKGNIDLDNYTLLELKHFGEQNEEGIVYAIATAAALNTIENCKNEDGTLNVEKAINDVTVIVDSIMDNVRDIISVVMKHINDLENQGGQNE